MGKSDIQEKQSLLVRSQNAKLQREIDRQERERLQLDEVKKSFINRDVADRTIIGAMRNYHDLVRRLLERNIPESNREKLQQLGASETIVALFYQFNLSGMQAVVDEIAQKWKTQKKIDFSD
jgi:hypothetical protein